MASEPWPRAFSADELERSHRLARQWLDLNVRMARAAAHGIDEQRMVGRQAVGLLGVSLEGPVLAAQTAMPGSEGPLMRLESAIEEETAALEDATDDWWVAMAEVTDDGVRSYADVAETYASFVDALFGATMDATGRLGAMVDDERADGGVNRP